MRLQRILMVGFMAVLLALAAPAFAANTINVPADQPTIQAGINAAGNGDTVLVAPGTYLENINFNSKNITVISSGGAASTTIDGHLGGGAPTVRGGGASSTTISGFTITGGGYGATSSAQQAAGIFSQGSFKILNNIITGNTCYGIYVQESQELIQNNIISNTLGGTTSACFTYAGAGILIFGVVESVNPTPPSPVSTYFPSSITGNTIQNNVHGSYAGGIVLEQAGPALIENNIIQNNTGAIAGAIYEDEGDFYNASILQNLITGNTSLGTGTASAGGISIQPSSPIELGFPPTAYIANNTITGNFLQNSSPSADAATEVSASYSPGGDSFSNNIIAGSSSTVPAFNCDSVFLQYSNDDASYAYIDHNDIYNSAGGPTIGGTNCIDPAGTYGNISADPKFAGPSLGNYHLAPGSPAIDTGDNSESGIPRTATNTNTEPGMPATDLSGNPRIQDATNLGYPIVDMGVYEASGLQDGAVTTATLVVTGANPIPPVDLNFPTLQSYTAGTALSLTASITSSNAAIPAGTVTFTQNNVVIGTATLDSSGNASVQTSALAPGSYSYVVTYLGASGFAPSSSVELLVFIKNYVPTMTFASSANPSFPGETVNFTGTIASPDSAALTPITITDESFNTTLATVDSSSGTFSYITSALTPGRHVIEAVFAGDGAHTSASAGIIQNVEYNPTVTLSVTSAGSPVTTVPTGTVVKLSVTVMNTATQPALGQVEFCDNAATLCSDIHLLGTEQLSSTGTAALSFIPGPGKHNIKVIYLGIAGVAQPATSANSPLLVLANGSSPSTTVLTVTGSPGNYTLTATVTGNGGTAPTGTISLLDSTNNDFELGSTSLGIGAGGLSFVNMATVPTGKGPVYMVAGDFDTQLNPYLAVANYGDNTLSILEAQPNDTFITTQTVATGTEPNYIAAGDFNSDGIPDLAVTNGGSATLSILQGTGNGTFSLERNYPTDPSPTTVVAGDFNRDGYEDLEVTDIFNSLGNPHYAPAQIFFDPYIGESYPAGSFDIDTSPTYTGLPITSVPSSIVAGDFNGDGVLDLAVTLQSLNETAIYLGITSATNSAACLNQVSIPQPLPQPQPPFYGLIASFCQLPSILVGNSPRSVVTGDFNNDGKLDLAVTNYGDNTVSILLGNGDGTFTTASTIPVGSKPIGITIGDYNGDGIPDLAVANSGSDTITILLGNGDGTFNPLAATIPTLSTPTSIATGDFNRDGLQDVAVTNAGANSVSVFTSKWSGSTSATISNIAPLPNGVTTHQIVAVYAGDSNYAASTSNTVSLTALPASTTLLLTAAPGSITVGQQVTFTATLSPLTLQGTAPRGTVTFTYNGNSIGTATLTTGIATVNTSTLPIGTDNIQAVYSGDGNFGTSTSNTLAFVVLPRSANVATTTTLFANPLSVYAGNTVTFKAMVPINVGGPAPSGSIAFLDGTTVLGTAPLLAVGSTWAANFSSDTLATGTHSITAVYSGNIYYLGSTSSVVTITILSNATSLELFSFLNPAAAYQPITLNAQLTSLTTTDFPGGGTVNFFANGNSIGSVPVDLTGLATLFDVALPAGNYELSATFSGNSSSASSSSANIPETVTSNTSSTLLSASPAPGFQNTPIILTAQVVSTSSYVSPTGNVSFYDGTSLLGAVPLNSTGYAYLIAYFPTAGTHNLTAVYAGNGSFTTSTSTPLALVIDPQLFSITAPPSFTLETQHHGGFAITLASIGSFSDNIAFSCGNLPPVATCTFSKDPVALAAGATATTTVSIETDVIPDFRSDLRRPASPREHFMQRTGIALAMLLPFTLLALRCRAHDQRSKNGDAPLPRRIRLLSTILFAIACGAVALSLNACSGKYPASTPPGTYTILITGQGLNTGVSSSANVTFIVTP